MYNNFILLNPLAKWLLASPFLRRGREGGVLLKSVTLLLFYSALLLISFNTPYAKDNSAEDRATEDKLAVLKNEPITPIVIDKNLDIKKVLLGEKLFFDTRLSADNSLSCASCHQFTLGGADAMQFATGIKGQKGSINTPTIFNSHYNIAQFWDGRVDSLQQQALEPVVNPIEMGEHWPNVIEKLSQDKALAKEFYQVYQQVISAENITNAIAEYEHSLVTINSPFDQFLLGDSNAISRKAKQGYTLFKSYGCISCHQGANVGGNLYHRLGNITSYLIPSDEELLKKNLGRYNVTHLVEDKYTFKVPSLRMVTKTAPYFHDGSIKTLQEAIKIMGKYQLFQDIPDQDVELIIEFLKTLVGHYQPLGLKRP